MSERLYVIEMPDGVKLELSRDTAHPMAWALVERRFTRGSWRAWGLVSLSSRRELIETRKHAHVAQIHRSIIIDPAHYQHQVVECRAVEAI